jgi:DNA-binding MarR family transcriptional regulator
MTVGPGTPALVEVLTQVSLLVQGALERSAAECGISVAQARLLAVLSDRAPTVNELAGLLGLDKSSTSGLVDRAQRRGLVRRVPSQLDRRSVRVRLSARGGALVGDVDRHFRQEVAALLEPVPAQEHAPLAAALAALVAARRLPSGTLGNVERHATAAIGRPASP